MNSVNEFSKEKLLKRELPMFFTAMTQDIRENPRLFKHLNQKFSSPEGCLSPRVANEKYWDDIYYADNDKKKN